MMKQFQVGLLATIFLTTVCNVGAQQPAKIPRIGYATGGGAAGQPTDPSVRVFRQLLKELGYVEGKNIAIEYRFSHGKGASVEAEQARELVRLNVDVLIATAYPAIRAAKEATKTIPIVIVSTRDPVASGLIDSLARPGGNVTGVTVLTRELSGKRLELLLEIVPKTSRVGLLRTTDSLAGADAVKQYEPAARALKVDLQPFMLNATNPDIAGAFAAAVKARVNAVIGIRNAAMNRLSKTIAEQAIKSRLPAMFERSLDVENGGLAAYTADELESYRRAAVFVDKILKGTKPADLPVEQPTKFEFVINLKTAKQIGLTVPPEVLARANRIIR